MSFPNQSKLILDRDYVNMDTPKEGGYTIIHNENLYIAASLLNKSGLAVWIFLVSQQPHYFNGKKIPKKTRESPRLFDFSPTAIKNKIDIDRNTVKNGMDDLKNNKFLEEVKPGVYHFYEIPQDYQTKKLEEIINYEITLDDIEREENEKQLKDEKQQKYSWED